MVVWKAIGQSAFCTDQYGAVNSGSPNGRTGADFAVMSGGGIRDSIEAAISAIKTC